MPKNFEQHLRHGQQGRILNPFCDVADDGALEIEMGNSLYDRPKVLRGNGCDDHIALIGRSFQFARDSQVGGQRNARKELRILMPRDA